MTQKKSVIEATAYHESGHAVMYNHLGMSWKYITLDPNWQNGTLAHIKGANSPKAMDADSYVDDKTRLCIEKQIMIAYAGGIAEKLFTGRLNRIGCQADYHSLVSLVSRISLSEQEQKAHLHWLKLRTKDLLELKHNWDRVESLAKALLALPEGKRRMSARQAQVVFDAAVDKKYGPLDAMLPR